MQVGEDCGDVQLWGDHGDLQVDGRRIMEMYTGEMCYLGPRVRFLFVVKDRSDMFVKLWISFLILGKGW